MTVATESLFLKDILNGLAQNPKSIPPKYFYNEIGSKLFQAICELDEYYVTRTEMAILQKAKHELSEMIGTQAQLIEPGSGAGEKIQVLLSTLKNPNAYIPIDISAETLFQSSQIIQNLFPGISVLPIKGDFFHSFQLPQASNNHSKKRVIFFPGSTIGNFLENEIKVFLANMLAILQPGDLLIIGIDLLKEKAIIEAAYNDSKGITAEFNLNLLHRINQELDGKIDPATFAHRAIFSSTKKRIEMHLVSLIHQTLKIGSHSFTIKKGETIHTENSTKFVLSEFKQLVEGVGFTHQKNWIDRKEYYSVCCFIV